MNILVTGGSGFIGSFIVKHFASQGCTVLVTTRNPRKAWRLAGVPHVHLLTGNLTNRAFIENIFRKYAPKHIVHAAWEGMTKDKRNHSQQILNLMATQNLLEVSAAMGCEVFTGIGSQAEYGIYNKMIREHCLSTPESLYGIYKLAAGLSGRLTAQRHGFKFAWLRLFSAFGPTDLEDYIIPYTIKSFLTQTSPRLSSCQQKWDYLYVKDIPFLIEKVIKKRGYFCDIYNLCAGKTYPLKNIILKIQALAKADVKAHFSPQAKSAEPLKGLWGDNSKFKRTFGWHRLTAMDTALQETVAWYRQHQKKEDL